MGLSSDLVLQTHKHSHDIGWMVEKGKMTILMTCKHSCYQAQLYYYSWLLV